jgi:hypothetical protein
LAASRLVSVNPDSDGDGLTDGFEDGTVRDGRIEGDTNNNRIYDPGEKWLETDPFNPDTDGDGLPDGWEIAHGLNPWDDGVIGHTNMNTAGIITNTINGANGDPDGDGQNNLAELLAGTDPMDSASVFRITSITREGNNIRVRWTTGPAKTNELQRATALTGAFTAIFTVTNTTGAVTNFLDIGVATNTSSRYYRVRLVP